jgi:ATP-binding cassette subfamily C (CFTR/MRP) protein 1
MQVIIISISAKYLAVTIPFSALTVFLVQKFYLKTSRQLRHLDLEAKAPLYSHLIETVNGLTSIRAFHWQKDLTDRNRFLLDESQKPIYLLYSLQRWLNLVLDLLVAGLAVILITLAVTLKGSITASGVGVALVNISTFNQNLMNLVKSWVFLETSLGAIARVRSFAMTTESEERPQALPMPEKTWPQKGEIRFENVVASYR